MYNHSLSLHLWKYISWIKSDSCLSLTPGTLSVKFLTAKSTNDSPRESMGWVGPALRQEKLFIWTLLQNYKFWHFIPWVDRWQETVLQRTDIQSKYLSEQTHTFHCRSERNVCSNCSSWLSFPSLLAKNMTKIFIKHNLRHISSQLSHKSINTK